MPVCIPQTAHCAQCWKHWTHVNRVWKMVSNLVMIYDLLFPCMKNGKHFSLCSQSHSCNWFSALCIVQWFQFWSFKFCMWQNTMAAFGSNINFYFKNLLHVYIAHTLPIYYSQNFSTVLVVQNGHGIWLKTANSIILKFIQNRQYVKNK